TAPGGASDIIIRPLAQRLTETLKQTFFIDNKPGASGIIAMEAGAKANPDGYTILFGTVGTFASNAAVHEKIPYDPIKDYAHVSLICKTYMVLIINPKLPINNVKEFVEYAKARPGKLTYGSYGMGSFAHLLAASFSDTTAIETVHVPYKGSLPAITALMAGEIDFMIDTLPSAVPFIKQNRIKALAISSPERFEATPEIATFAESGYPQFKPNAWWGIAAPANTPKAIVQKLNAAISEALKTPDLTDRYRASYAIPVGGPSDELLKQISTDLKSLTETAKKGKISINN
ncbi:MAG: tripartite tricarboxylate transporter substrate binding protein, partial [Polynucleobacter sp.]|nr:tripartite tricarboxylate transporter substrate binding protein [Polynucleobacter sp.]